MTAPDRLLSLLFPPKCAFCGRLVALRDRGVCPECRRTLPRIRDCDGGKADFVDAVASPLYYEGAVRDSLLRYKFHGVTALQRAYGPLLAEAVTQALSGRFDTITWAPLSRKRLRQRGYDQARLLAEAVAGELGMTAVPLLRKTRDAPPQSGTGSAAKRRANISGCYAASAPCAGLRVLVIDDIFTTGATLSECARVLMLAGAESVCGATLAAHRDE